MVLVVVEDRHAERELRTALDSLRARGMSATVLTGDALLAMRLRRDGVTARLTIDGLSFEALLDRDRAALDGVARAFGSGTGPGAGPVDARPEPFDSSLTLSPSKGERLAQDRLDEGRSQGRLQAGRDYSEALGTSFGKYLQYTLIPVFIRAVRNVTAMDAALSAARGSATGSEPPSGAATGGSDPQFGSDPRIMLVGGGPLVDAARLVAARRGIAAEPVHGDLFRRAALSWTRLRAGRATKWVNTDFRALVLEPGVIWLRFLQGLWGRIVRPARPGPQPRALIVTGDRFTADVVERLRGRPMVLAGATQPGRALFDTQPDLLPLESFTELRDVLTWAGAVVDALGEALAFTSDRAHGERFTVAGVPYWPLVARTVWLHVVAWVPALRHLQALTARAARAHPDARLLTSGDVTAYTRVLVDTARRFGVPSIGVQHGMTGEPNGHSIVNVGTLAAWGEATEPWYRDRAPQTARFVVTGNPRFDRLALRPARGERSQNSSLILSPAKDERAAALGPSPSALFTVTICTGFLSDFSVGASEYENLLMIDSVMAWARAREDVRVIHKMHPGEEREYYAEAARTLGWDPMTLTTIREPILWDVLEKSDVLVAAYSTTVLESIALGTPAIVFDGMVQRKLLPLDRIPGVTIAYSVGDLHNQLEARRTAPPPDRASLRSSAALRAYISELDGKATERLAALIE